MQIVFICIVNTTRQRLVMKQNFHLIVIFSIPKLTFILESL